VEDGEARPAAARMSSVLVRLARILVAAALTAYMFWLSRPREVVAAAAGAEWRWLAIAVLLVLLDRVLMAYRWVLLLCTSRPRPPLGGVLRIFFISTFVGTFLPSVGGDALRAYSVTKLNVDGGDAVASVFMDRMLGVASILAMALVGLTMARDLAGNWATVAALAAAGAACALTLLLVFDPAAAGAASRLLARFPPAFRHAAGRVLAAVRRYAAHRRQLGNVLACSIVVQTLRILQAYCVGRALGLDVALAAYFAVVPLILLVMLLPVTVSGLGTGQAAFLFFFAPFGVPPAPAFALSVLFIGLAIVGNLPGGVLYAAGKRGAAAT
jgi:uncharacterized protein (TIRG00374 family)